MKRCLYCEMEFFHYKKDIKFCSQECYRSYLKKYGERKSCKVCNKKFIDESGSQTRLYCSRMCINQSYYNRRVGKCILE